MLFIYFCFFATPFDSQENPSPIWFPGKCILVWFPWKSMPLDLNLTNPKSTIFEPGWKSTTFACKSWSDYQTASYLFFFKIKKKMDRFCILCVSWIGKKYRGISQKIGKNTDKYRNIGDISEILPKFPSTKNIKSEPDDKRNFAVIFLYFKHWLRMIYKRRWKSRFKKGTTLSLVGFSSSILRFCS